MYKKDLLIENPKKFQRHIYDIASSVLFSKGYYLSGKYSKFPHLKANGIANLADFHGLLCFVKNHRNYNLISRIIGICLLVVSVFYWLYPTFILTDQFYFDWLNFPAWIMIAVGIILIILKFGKDVCIEIRLVGEAYRTDIIKDENTAEYLGVRCDARLTVQASTLDPTKTLSNNDIQKLNEDGSILTGELNLFLEKYFETQRNEK